MRSLLTFLLVCFCLSLATAQTTRNPSTTVKKPTTTRKPGTTAARRPTAPKATTVVATPVEPAASTLTFPSTEPENVTTMDAAKKQQMYDELHGVKPQSTTPDTGKRGRGRSRDAEETATRTDRRATAAPSDEAGTYIGIRAGGNYSTLLEKPVGETIDPVYGFHAGVVFQFGRGGIAFQPEINFQQDYANVLTFNGTTLVKSTQAVNSLVVPLFAKFQFGQQGSTRFFVNVGPYGTYSLESRPAGSETVIGYGGALGLGVGIPAGSGKFTIEARGYYSLGDTQNSFDFGNPPGKPILGQLSVGYLFPLGSR